jgi:hypothetical protein
MARNGGNPRFNLTLSEEEAGRLEAYAASVSRRPTTAAKELLLAWLEAAGSNGGHDVAALQRRHEEVLRERDDLQRQLTDVIQGRPVTNDPDRVIPAESPAAPKRSRRSPSRRRDARWEWPAPDLLDETAWWDRWLPRLYELLGRDLRGEPDQWGGSEQLVVDRRGYADLLTYLFPPIGSVTWRSPAYARAAADKARQGGQEDALWSLRVQAWYPVLRHVAKALCALEETSAARTDPQLRLEAEARLTGSWVQVLGNLVGDRQTGRLPRPVP